MNAVTKSTALGALAGSLLLGTSGYLVSRNRKNRIRRAIMLAITGGALGGLAGRLGYGHMDFIRRRNDAIKIPEGEKAEPGTVYFVDHPGNEIDVSKTNIPWLDRGAGFIKKRFGWDGKMHIGHSGIVTVDDNGNAVRYDYGLFGKPKAELLEDKLPNLKGVSKKEIAKLLQERYRHWGKITNMSSAKVKDVGVARRLMKGIMSPDSDGFSFIPGGYSCSPVARMAFDASTGDSTSHLRDLLAGGFPSSNMPTHNTEITEYEAE